MVLFENITNNKYCIMFELSNNYEVGLVYIPGIDKNAKLIMIYY